MVHKFKKVHSPATVALYFIIPIYHQYMMVTRIKMQVMLSASLPAATVLKPQHAIIHSGASGSHGASNHCRSPQILQKGSDIFAETTIA